VYRSSEKYQINVTCRTIELVLSKLDTGQTVVTPTSPKGQRLPPLGLRVKCSTQPSISDLVKLIARREPDMVLVGVKRRSNTCVGLDKSL